MTTESKPMSGREWLAARARDALQYGHMLTARELVDEVYERAGELQAMAQALGRDLRGGAR